MYTRDWNNIFFNSNIANLTIFKALAFFLSKYTTLNIKEPTSTIPKPYVVPIVPSNSPTNLSPSRHNPYNPKQLKK
jgi:hypothetical protein